MLLFLFSTNLSFFTCNILLLRFPKLIYITYDVTNLFCMNYLNALKKIDLKIISKLLIVLVSINLLKFSLLAVGGFFVFQDINPYMLYLDKMFDFAFTSLLFFIMLFFYFCLIKNCFFTLDRNKKSFWICIFILLFLFIFTLTLFMSNFDKFLFFIKKIFITENSSNIGFFSFILLSKKPKKNKTYNKREFHGKVPENIFELIIMILEFFTENDNKIKIENCTSRGIFKTVTGPNGEKIIVTMKGEVKREYSQLTGSSRLIDQQQQKSQQLIQKRDFNLFDPKTNPIYKKYIEGNVKHYTDYRLKISTKIKSKQELIINFVKNLTVKDCIEMTVLGTALYLAPIQLKQGYKEYKIWYHETRDWIVNSDLYKELTIEFELKKALARDIYFNTKIQIIEIKNNVIILCDTDLNSFHFDNLNSMITQLPLILNEYPLLLNAI